jgi:hypothetical protein
MLCVLAAVAPNVFMNTTDIDDIWPLIYELCKPLIPSSKQTHREYENVAVCLSAYASISDPMFFISDCCHNVNKLRSLRGSDQQGIDKEEKDKNRVTILQAITAKKPMPDESSSIAKKIFRPCSIPVIAEHLLAISSSAQSKVL